jgi:hypothetical protein
MAAPCPNPRVKTSPYNFRIANRGIIRCKSKLLILSNLSHLPLDRFFRLGGGARTRVASCFGEGQEAGSEEAGVGSEFGREDVGGGGGIAGGERAVRGSEAVDVAAVAQFLKD